MMKQVAIYGKQFPAEVVEHIQTLVEELQNQQFEISVFEPFYSVIRDSVTFSPAPRLFTGHHELKNNTAFLVSVGGDGTLLDTLTIIRDSGIPVIGINLGKLGFLSGVSRNEIARAMYDIRHGAFQIETRSLIHLDSRNNLFGDLNFALNEVTIIKGDQRSLATIHVWVDDQFLNSYWADGLIIATPTGSTAYSLSCSGPILVPSAPNFIINPIATHNLTVRPMIIPDNTSIRIRVEGRCDRYIVNLDSRSEWVDKDTELTLKKENFSFNLIKLNHKDFFTTIREKLLWGHDKRN